MFDSIAQPSLFDGLVEIVPAGCLYPSHAASTGYSLGCRCVRCKSAQALNNVDHDHRCCDGERACGECVRGLAHEGCNRKLGPLEVLIREVGAARVHELVELLEAGRAA